MFTNNETGDFLLDKFKQLSSRVPNVDTNLIEGLQNYPRGLEAYKLITIRTWGQNKRRTSRSL